MAIILGLTRTLIAEVRMDGGWVVAGGALEMQCFVHSPARRSKQEKETTDKLRRSVDFIQPSFFPDYIRSVLCVVV